MKKIISEKIIRITKNRKKLEVKLNVKITNRGKEIFIAGKSENEHIAEKVIDALDFGFPFSTTMLIRDEDFEFEIIKIKDYTKRNDLFRIRARIIGRNGKTLKTLSQLTGCFFEIKDNFIGIIGSPEYLKNAQEAIISIIKGSKQSNVYKSLEQHQIKEVIDLGLR